MNRLRAFRAHLATRLSLCGLELAAIVVAFVAGWTSVYAAWGLTFMIVSLGILLVDVLWHPLGHDIRVPEEESK